MVSVCINGKEYRIRFTIGFWKKIKEAADVTQENLEQKLKEDFGKISSLVIYWGIHYGFNPLPKESPVTMEQIEGELDRSVIDIIEQAVIEGMTKEEKRILEIVKKKKDDELLKLENSDDKGENSSRSKKK